jgi:predicted  nucleic acid-binding Zn-ribbon protein
MAQQNGVTGPDHQLDQAGQTILQLLNKAADVAEQNSRYAMDTAQQLSYQLHAAEDRIAQLEAEVEARRQKADRAEQWLHTVYTEIEKRLMNPGPHPESGRH